MVQTLHGQFTFYNQKFYSVQEASSAFLHANEDFASSVSRGLEEFAMHTCLSSVSYEKARQVMVRMSG